MIPSLPCVTVLVFRREWDSHQAPRGGIYLLAIEAAVIGSDGDELFTSDGETVAQSRSTILEGTGNSSKLVR